MAFYRCGSGQRSTTVVTGTVQCTVTSEKSAYASVPALANYAHVVVGYISQYYDSNTGNNVTITAGYTKSNSRITLTIPSVENHNVFMASYPPFVTYVAWND